MVFWSHFLEEICEIYFGVVRARRENGQVGREHEASRGVGVAEDDVLSFGRSIEDVVYPV